MTPRALGSNTSLQRRLCIWLGAGVVACWLAGAAVAGYILQQEIDEVFDSALQEVAQRVLPLAYMELLDRDTLTEELVEPTRIAPVDPHSEYITYVIRDATGRVLLQSHDANPSLLTRDLRKGFQDGPVSRQYTEAAVRESMFVTTSERPGHRGGAIFKAIQSLLWPLLLLLPLSVTATWLLVILSLRPVATFRRAIEARNETHLSPVETEALPTEIRPAAEAVNTLLGRLKRALDAERSFTGNSAHELRTPIAAALAQTQRLLADLPEGRHREQALTIEAALRRLARLSEKLLQLAKAEGGGLLASTPQDLVQALRFVLDDFRRAPGGAERLEVTTPPSGSLLSTLDMDAFAILARNLIENALKHGDDTSAVRVTLSETGDFKVTNRATRLTPEALAGLKRPFARGDTVADGSGLGLTIAAAIARGVGGELNLHSPVPGEADGFEAGLRLPLAADAKLNAS
ncbi:MAG: HAMP domain-containing sensor histidine kinase [Beijerinckiaceae bacterium]|nr:HAMP domain-containing sensor histidine kinase [Beijerinckiaceae bacterium]